jgi:[ribosomal protein S18]-alanine N-acetyltransferase
MPKATEGSDAAQQVQIADAGAGDLMGLRNLQRHCFQDGQAYGITTLLVFHLWPRARVLIARFDDEVIGCVIGDVQRDQARVLNLCVEPRYRRYGVGSALLSAIESVLDHDNMTLMVEDKNHAAQALYRRHGYLSVGDLRDYYGRNRHGVLMQKRRARPPIGYRPELTISDRRDDE